MRPAILAPPMLTMATSAVIAILIESRVAAVVAIASYGLIFLGLALVDPDRVPHALLFLLPLVTLEVGFGDLNRTLSADKVALGVVAATWWVRRGAAGLLGAFRGVTAARWLGAFCIVVALGAAGRGFAGQQIWALAEQVVILSVFLSAVEAFGSDVQRRRAVVALVTASAVVAALTAGQALVHGVSGRSVLLFFKAGTIMDQFNVIRDMPSTIAHANSLGAYIVLVLPVTIALVLGRPTRSRAVLCAVVGLQVIAIALATSIGTYVSLAVLGAVAAYILWPRLGTVTRSALIIAAIGAVLVGAREWRETPYSFTERLELYQVAGRMTLDHPILGLGAGGFRDAFAVYYPGRWERQPFQVAEHSSFVAILVAWGIPGLLCFVGSLAAVFRDTWPAVTRIRRGGGSLLALGLWLGSLAFVVNAISENLFGFSKLSGVFWIVAALLLRLMAAPPEPADHRAVAAARR